jgi:hypothetical protein
MTAAWMLLWTTTVALLTLAVYLLFRMNLFSDDPLADEGLKALWAFLGVALGAVATILGTLLTYQAGRRSEALARETEQRLTLEGKRSARLADETEQRLKLDLRAKVLELITDEGGEYAKPARVAGAVATLMELGVYGLTARITREVWLSKSIGTSAAVWTLNQILADTSCPDEDKEAASEALYANYECLFPRPTDADQNWHAWPGTFLDRWPHDLPTTVRTNLLVICVKTMLAREPDFWKESVPEPLVTLGHAVVEDPVDPDVGGLVALVYLAFAECLGQPTGFEMEEQRLRDLAADADPTPWFAKLVDQIEPWSRGEDVVAVRDGVSQVPAPASSSSSKE